MLRILSAFLISLAASFFAAPFALAFDGPPGPGEERKQPGSLATDLVKACQLADPDDVPAFELCRPQAQEQQAPREQDRQQQVKQVQHQQNAADQGTVGQSTEPKSESAEPINE